MDMLRVGRAGVRHGRCLIAALCFFLFCLSAMPAQAAQGGRLTLYYDHEGVTFRMYRVADAEGEWTGSFSSCAVDNWQEDTNRARQEAAHTLVAYVSDHHILPSADGVSAAGSVSIDQLDDGRYLVTGETSSRAGHTYAPIPFLVDIKGADAQVTASVKADQSDGPQAPTTMPSRPVRSQHPLTPSPAGQQPEHKTDRTTRPHVVRTGDSSAPMWWAVAFGAAALALAWLLRARACTRRP